VEHTHSQEHDAETQVQRAPAVPRRLIRVMHLVSWIAGALVLILALWKLPQWQVARLPDLSPKERFDRENEARKTLATIIGGVVVLAGGFATWRTLKLTQQSLYTAQQGQLTDRFTKAIEQLGAVDAGGIKKLEVRLGGIYALERIAHDSERDHWPIVEVLCAYVRQNAARSAKELAADYEEESAEGLEMTVEDSFEVDVSREGEDEEEAVERTDNSEVEEPDEPPPLAADIQAILTVLGRRHQEYEREGQCLDLNKTKLRRANLVKADLRGADFFRADLKDADLTDARLAEASFSQAKLMYADLLRATLSGAYLGWADLSHVRADKADFRAAKLIDTKFCDAYLNEADFSGHTGVGERQLEPSDFCNAELKGAKFRGARISASLQGAKLGDACLANGEFSGNFKDTDLAKADLRGADLSKVLYLTQQQIDSAKGDATTQLPYGLKMPEGWKK